MVNRFPPEEDDLDEMEDSYIQENNSDSQEETWRSYDIEEVEDDGLFTDEYP